MLLLILLAFRGEYVLRALLDYVQKPFLFVKVGKGLLFPNGFEVEEFRPDLEANVLLMGIHEYVVLNVHGSAVLGVVVSQKERPFYLIVKDAGVMPRCC